jgi:hypothetical protein
MPGRRKVTVVTTCYLLGDIEKPLSHESDEPIMYTLNLADVARFDLDKAQDFVEFWNRYYTDSTTVFETEDKIDYFSELNIGNDLTEENLRRLLRWKDPHYLTHIHSETREDNPKVAKALKQLAAINLFRNGGSAEEDMRKTAAQVFPTGFIWQVFLLHVAKPNVYPIADENVFRVFSLHTGVEAKQDWDTYIAYSKYFGQIAEKLGVPRTVENLSQLKRIDNALVVFGQFLRAYYP